MELDPRWWRISRHGTAPHVALQSIQEYAALAVFLDEKSDPCGAAGLADVSGAATCGTLDLVAMPGAEPRVTHIAPELVQAAFMASPIRHLYVERFDDDPDLLASAPCFELEVRLPEFAFVDGRLVDRLVFGASRSDVEAMTDSELPVPETSDA